MTSLMRLAATMERGASMNIRLSSMNAMMTCRAYCEKTVMSRNRSPLPASGAPSIRYAPIQYTISDSPFMMSIIDGSMMAMMR